MILGFAVVAGHNNEIAAVKLPVAEVDDLRMTAIVLFQQGLGSAGNRAANGFQKTVTGAIVAFRYGELSGYFVEFKSGFRCDDIRQLHGVADDDSISGNG